MTIILEASKVKVSNPDTSFSISDNTMDWKSVSRTDYTFELKGNGTRNLVIKNLWGTLNSPAVIDCNFIIRHGGTAPIIKFVNCRYWKVLFGGSQIYGSGNNQSQPIFIEGTCKGWEFIGGYINQGRNSQGGETKGGACFQAASAESSSLNASNHNAEYAIQRGIILENCCDEGFYLFKYTGSGTYKPSGAEYALIENCRVVNSGRDPFQGRGIKRFELLNNHAENWGLELETNHISGVSWNAENPSGLIKGNSFINGPQFIFAGTEGIYTKVDIEDNVYEQGTHAGVRSNQACYLKGPGEYILKNNVIKAPNVKLAALTADGCRIVVESTNVITAPTLYRTFNNGSVTQPKPPPVTVVTHQDLEVHTTTTWDNVVVIRYFSIVDGVKTEFVKL